MSTPDLETRIRSYYRTCEPKDSARLMVASRELLEEARRPRPRRLLWGGLRLAATLAAAAMLLAVLVLPRLGGQVGGQVEGPVPLAGPTFDLPAALNAQVDEAGLMRTGGIWAVQGSYFLTSTDNGTTWRAGTFPSPSETVPLGEIFVLDQDHAWVIESNWVNGSLATPSVPGGLFVLDRTANGGRTWQSTTVSGDSRCDSATLSFVDAGHGFIMCSYGSTPGPNGSNNEVRTQATKGSGTVLRTDDGGATWSVAGRAIGLGSAFTASDATTLWSAPDASSSAYTGAALYVSRDAGSTWSTIDLAGLPAAPYLPMTEVGIPAGPVFWDASNGAIAVNVYFNGSGTPPAIWFYRTSDAGRSWALVKKPVRDPSMGAPFPEVLAGREWATIWLDGFDGMTTSSDFGATWTRTPWSVMPANSPPMWLDFTDGSHAAATVFAGPGSHALMLSADGGRTWRAANFGDARTKVPADSAQDWVTAKGTAEEFTTMTVKVPPSAWGMLSAYSQRAFGSESAFEAAMVALGKRTNYALTIGDPTQSADLLSQQDPGSGAWADLTAHADMSRAYVVKVSFPGTSEPAETLVVAPLSATGDWRIWVVTTP